jgi:hypothetical protein
VHLGGGQGSEVILIGHKPDHDTGGQLNALARLQRMAVDPASIDLKSIGAIEIGNPPTSRALLYFSMFTRDLLIRQNDVVRREAPNAQVVMIERHALEAILRRDLQIGHAVRLRCQVSAKLDKLLGTARKRVRRSLLHAV